jgi:signal transduction histidine kinase
MEISMGYQDIDTGGFEFRIGFQGLVVLNIRDNGKGIDLNDTTPGLGLLGMRERVEALQGAFELLSCPGEGVAIRVMLPT